MNDNEQLWKKEWFFIQFLRNAPSGASCRANLARQPIVGWYFALGSERTIKMGPYLEVHDDRALPMVSFLTVHHSKFPDCGQRGVGHGKRMGGAVWT